MRVHHEKKTDGERVGNEKKSDGFAVTHEKERRGEFTIKKSDEVRVNH